MKDLPDWVLKYKVKGTNIIKKNNNYYLYLEFPLKISHTKISKIAHTFIPKSSLFCLILGFFVLFS